MSLTISPRLETRLRAQAEAAGLTVEAYLERLVQADQQAGGELETLAIEGLDSGPSLEAGPGYWEEKHRRIEGRLAKTGLR